MSVKSKIQAVKDIINMQFIKNKPSYNVMSITDTIDAIVTGKLSVSRYGDGEIFMMANQMNDSFQTYDAFLADKLIHILKNPIENHLVCLPDIFDDLTKYNSLAMKWFDYFLTRKKYLYYRYFDTDYAYGNAFITRCYMDLIDKSESKKYFNSLKNIWDNRDIVFIEGEFSRLGYGNDLFDNAKSIRRILAPAKNAYVVYDKIVEEASKLDKNCLILIALGATATCLAYDLTKLGFQAVDCGHVDVEYEWMRMGATKKVPIPSKYVNEAGDEGHKEEILHDKIYQLEIIAKIGTKFN